MNRNGGNANPFFRQAGQQWMGYAIDLYLLARPGKPLSVGIIHEIILSSPANLEQVHNDEWLKDSLCNRLLDEALARKEQMTERQQKDFDLIGKFWFREVPQLAPETRSSIISTFTVAADLFLRGNMAEMFCTTTTIVPELTHEGGIIVLDMPLKTYGREGLAAQTLMQLMWEQATERRDVTSNRRSVCAWMNEAHLFVNEEAVSFAQPRAKNSPRW
jgi:type IV secretory pathway TraG/TraD family ATPase VirD4